MKRPPHLNVRFWYKTHPNPFDLALPSSCVLFRWAGCHVITVVRGSVKPKRMFSLLWGQKPWAVMTEAWPDHAGGGLTAHSATSLLDYDFGVVCIDPEGKKTTWFITYCKTAVTYLNESKIAVRKSIRFITRDWHIRNSFKFGINDAWTGLEVWELGYLQFVNHVPSNSQWIKCIFSAIYWHSDTLLFSFKT